LQADRQTSVNVLCIAGLHVLDKKNIKNVGKMKKKRYKRFLHLRITVLLYGENVVQIGRES